MPPEWVTQALRLVTRMTVGTVPSTVSDGMRAKHDDAHAYGDAAADQT